MTWTIGRKMAAGFSVAVVVLAGLVVYNFLGLTKLTDLQDEGAGRASDAIQLTEIAGTVPRMYQIIADAVINRNLEASLVDWAEIKKEMDGDLTTVTAAVDTPEEVRLHEEGVAAYNILVSLFENEMLPVLRKSAGVPEEIKELDGRVDESVGVMIEKYNAIRDSLIAESDEADEVFDSVGSSTIQISATAAILAAIGLILIGVFTSRSIVRPIRAMIAAMLRLAGGDHEIEVPAVGRKDEIGEMAEAVQVFKDNAIEKVRLEAEQVAAEKRAEEEKRTTMNRMADEFEASVGNVVRTVSSASTEMQATAESMSTTAEETSRQSTTVAAAAEQTSANVQTVASATEELSSSISEIARQVAQSAEIAAGAVKEAHRTNQRVQGLADAAQKIGEVIALINDIADQTNLLALNATIEAARAGDAGKGFAVVASEVKNLANQTAKATEEISSQIASVQAATEEAVGAIREIGTTIGQIDEIATTIASAVEEQGAATHEIARNVEQAASGTQDVTSNIGSVTQAANDTGAASSQVLQSASDLSEQSELLRQEVDQFVAKVRVA